MCLWYGGGVAYRVKLPRDYLCWDGVHPVGYRLRVLAMTSHGELTTSDSRQGLTRMHVPAASLPMNHFTACLILISHAI